MPGRSFIQNGSMVLRLRLAFLVIFFALAAFGLFSQQRFQDIADRKGALTQQAIPVLVRAQELVALLSIQSQQIINLRDIDTTADFDEIGKIAQARQIHFNQRLREYETLSNDQGLQDAATLLFASTATLIDLQGHRKDLVIERGDQLTNLRLIVDETELQIEAMRLDVLTQFQSNIDALSDDPNAADLVAMQSVQLNTLISLGLLIERLQDLVETTGDGQAPLSSASVVEDIRFHLRQILGLLNRIPQSEDRAELASALALLRALISQPEGLLSNADKQGAAHADIALVVDVSREQVQRIEAQISGTILAASAAAQETSQLLDQSIRTLTVMNLVMIVGFFGGLILVVLFLVELQLNRRIKSLTISVRQFAGGNYEDTIDVQGGDELGEVANALRLSQAVALDLKRSNSDLRSFAYAASHDLKTPLRAITDLAEWTLEDARDQLSPEHVENLELLSNRSERLSHLLDGLLLYAQIDGMDAPSVQFNLKAECTEIADLLDPDGTYIVIVEEPSLPFSAPVVPLRQILSNLLSNAMKHHDKDVGTINVRAHVGQEFVEIEVQDDGPGIPEVYHSKIFDLFQKLESADVVEGAGIGLSLVKKLAERHGGGVRLLSRQNDDRGTIFTVRLATEATP